VAGVSKVKGFVSQKIFVQFPQLLSRFWRLSFCQRCRVFM